MTIDWGPFYTGLIIFGLIAALAGIFSGPLNRVMEKVEEKASGRSTHV